MAQQQFIQILSSDLKEGVGKTSKAPYKMIICQAVLFVDGQPKVGELTMPKDAAAPAPGRYTAEFGLGIDYASKKLVAQIVALIPFKDGAPAR